MQHLVKNFRDKGEHLVEVDRVMIMRLHSNDGILICSRSDARTRNLTSIIEKQPRILLVCSDSLYPFGQTFSMDTWRKMRALSAQLRIDWGVVGWTPNLSVDSDVAGKLIALAYLRALIRRSDAKSHNASRTLMPLHSEWDCQNLTRPPSFQGSLWIEDWLAKWQNRRLEPHQSFSVELEKTGLRKAFEEAEAQKELQKHKIEEQAKAEIEAREEQKRTRSLAIIEAEAKKKLAKERDLQEKRAKIRAEIAVLNEDFNRRNRGRDHIPTPELMGNDGGRESERRNKHYDE